MGVRADYFVHVVVEGLQEGFWHWNDRCRDNIFSVSLKKLLLLVSCHLDRLEVGFTGSLSENTLVLATWPVGHVTLSRIVL